MKLKRDVLLQNSWAAPEIQDLGYGKQRADMNRSSQRAQSWDHGDSLSSGFAKEGQNSSPGFCHSLVNWADDEFGTLSEGNEPSDLNLRAARTRAKSILLPSQPLFKIFVVVVSASCFRQRLTRLQSYPITVRMYIFDLAMDRELSARNTSFNE